MVADTELAQRLDDVGAVEWSCHALHRRHATRSPPRARGPIARDRWTNAPSSERRRGRPLSQLKFSDLTRATGICKSVGAGGEDAVPEAPRPQDSKSPGVFLRLENERSWSAVSPLAEPRRQHLADDRGDARGVDERAGPRRPLRRRHAEAVVRQ